MLPVIKLFFSPNLVCFFVFFTYAKFVHVPRGLLKTLLQGRSHLLSAAGHLFGTSRWVLFR